LNKKDKFTCDVSLGGIRELVTDQITCNGSHSETVQNKLDNSEITHLTSKHEMYHFRTGDTYVH
jgi:hypothetical protein